MSPALEKLLALQAIDRKFRALGEQGAAIQAKKQSAARGVDAARAALVRHQEALRAHEMARRTGEKEADALAGEEKRYQSQTVMVKTNDELKALQHEIDAVRARRSEIETRVLERLEQEEAERERGAALEGALAAAERLQQSEAEAAASAAELLKTEEAQLRQHREALANEIPADLRQRYERLVKSKPDGLAVVQLVRGACGGCFTAQPPARAQQARAGEQPVPCEYCGRMIVGEAGASPA